MDLNLGGKRALVTGSSGGIGRAIAEMLAKEGSTVFVNGRSPANVENVVAAIREDGGDALPAPGDLEEDDGRDAVLMAAGPIDILVNNVGGAVKEGVRPWPDVSASDWAAAFNKNVGGAAVLIRALLPAMTARRWGRIINISTVAAIEPTGAIPEYAAAKAALNSLTKSLSRAVAQTGITANTVTSGIVMTPVTQRWIASYAAERGWPGDQAEHEKRYARDVRALAVEAFASAEDIAYAVAMLASPRSWYMTGANLRVDGGASQSV